MLNWAQRRKFVVLAIGGIVTLIVAGVIVAPFFRASSEKNDITDARALNTLWSRYFPTRAGFVDAAAFVENPNSFGALKFAYTFTLYDQNNILITIRRGETFVFSRERFLIVEPNLAISERSVARVLFSVEKVDWSRDVSEKFLSIDVLGSERFLEEDVPRAIVSIKNNSTEIYRNIEASVVLWRGNEVAAVSRTVIPVLNIGEVRDLTFTWPQPVLNVSKVEAFFRSTSL